MNLKVEHKADGGMAIHGQVPDQLVFKLDGSVEVAQRSSGDLAGSLSVATLADIFEYGGKPKFSVEVWPGLPDKIPQGYTQSSGQQMWNVQFPELRADVVASQFFCTEAEWQADAYKRVTHWSLGDGDETTGSWMRPPDKNGVQPGNVGAFYGAGSNPAGAKTGTAVIDAMRNIVGVIRPITLGRTGVVSVEFSGPFSSDGNVDTSIINPGGSTGVHSLRFDASKALPAGTTTDPITGEFRPRTWYGIWMIRMYGRVVNTGLLDASGLNARMDMIDTRVATLEGRQKALGDGQSWKDVTASRATNTTYTNLTGRTIYVLAIVDVGPGAELVVDGMVYPLSDYAGTLLQIHPFPVPNNGTYRLNGIGLTGNAKWMELR